MARPKKHVPVWDFKDGWVYVDGVKTKKYYTKINQYRVWEPRMEDLAGLESLFTRSVDYYVKYRKSVWDIAFNALVALGGSGHCQPTHKYSGTQGAWWEYVIEDTHPSYGTGKAWHHSWCDRKPRKLMNVAEATEFYRVNQRSDDLANRYIKVKEVWLTAMGTYFREDFPVTLIDIGRLMWVNINERKYLFRVECTPKGYCYWTLIHSDDNIPMVML